MTTRHRFAKFSRGASRRPMRTRKPSQTRTRLHCEEFEPRTLLSFATQFSVVPQATNHDGPLATRPRGTRVNDR
jgi:hypothetical protein